MLLRLSVALGPDRQIQLPGNFIHELPDGSHRTRALHIAERAFKEIIPVLLPHISSEDINPVDEVIFSPIEMPRMGRLMTVDYLLPSFLGRPTNDLVLIEAGKATEIIRGDN